MEPNPSRSVAFKTLCSSAEKPNRVVEFRTIDVPENVVAKTLAEPYLPSPTLYIRYACTFWTDWLLVARTQIPGEWYNRTSDYLYLSELKMELKKTRQDSAQPKG